MDIIDHVATAPGPLACTATALGSVLVNDVWTPPPPINFVHDQISFN